MAFALALTVVIRQLPDALGVREVGAFEPPHLRPGWPVLPWPEWVRLGELAFGLVVLIFAESWGNMRSLALSQGDALDANRELRVLGACNLGAALLQGLPVGAGFSATMPNAAAGASSRWAGAVALGVVLLLLAFALPALHLLPRPVLAVAVVGALWHALCPQPLPHTWRLRRDRLLVVVAVLAVLLLGVLGDLGELERTRNFVARDAHPCAAAVPGLLVLRPEAPLFFASAERLTAEVMVQALQRPALRAVVLSLEESADLDSTALECLLELDQRERPGIPGLAAPNKVIGKRVRSC